MPELVKSPSSGTVYLIQNGQKLPIAGPWVMQANGWNFNQVKTVPESSINRYPTGTVLNTNASQPNAQPSPNPVQDTADTILQQSLKANADYFAKVGAFEAANPFAFDEALAKSAATERVNPYYDQKLGDFLQGINVQKTRSTEDRQTILTQIQADTDSYTGNNKFLFDRAIRQSEQGQADAGLFESGNAKAATGEATVQNNGQVTDYLRGQQNRTDSANTNATRIGQDLTLQQSQGTRDINAQKAADINTDVQVQQGESQKKYYLGEQAALGLAPGQTAQDYQNQKLRLLGL